MSQTIKRIAVLTSGGDAPGMNAALRAVVRTGIHNGLDVFGIRRGYLGLMQGDMTEMKVDSVSDIIQRGGTILQTARSREMMNPEGQKQAAGIIRARGIDALIVIGGDGSFAGAECLRKLGVRVAGIPATIDLDIACTEYTIGFDTAVNTAMDAVDKIRDTSASHERCSIIEVMGRSAGYIALWTGIASGAEDTLLPEVYDGNEQALIESILSNRALGKTHHIIVNAEGIGHSTALAERIEKATGIETRASVLGYMQRGGGPSCRDRVNASIMGAKSVEWLMEGKTDFIVALQGGQFVCVPFDEAMQMTKKLPEDQIGIAGSLRR